jgi:hypothetical protein
MEREKDCIKQLTLILLYLSAWEENALGEKALRSWKGYNFDILNELSDEKLIMDGRRSKSVWFTEEGERVAKDLLEKYHINI